jgi:hypothetical protein
MPESNRPLPHQEPLAPADSERRLQPDPMLRTGTRGSAWIWSIAGIVVVIIVLTLVATTGRHGNGPNQAANPPAATTGSGATTGASPGAPIPGRGNADAPVTGNQSAPR